jgi:rare lipoprotein A
MVKSIIGIGYLLMLLGCHDNQYFDKVPGKILDNQQQLISNKLLENNLGAHHQMTKDYMPSKRQAIASIPVKSINKPSNHYANLESYAVGGKRYQVMQTASGYKTKGLASWYGTKFHSQRTSSGENYNMYAMTAAHRTLPLSTYVRVKNVYNGREAIVKVNDRGPFHSKRVIDLSYAAANKLGLFPKGIALVEIEALMGKTPEKKRQSAQYYIQTGAFSSINLAQQLKAKLTQITQSDVIIEKYNKKYRVKVGPFTTAHLSDNLKYKLAKQGLNVSLSMIR